MGTLICLFCQFCQSLVLKPTAKLAKHVYKDSGQFTQDWINSTTALDPQKHKSNTSRSDSDRGKNAGVQKGL